MPPFQSAYDSLVAIFAETGQKVGVNLNRWAWLTGRRCIMHLANSNHNRTFNHNHTCNL